MPPGCRDNPKDTAGSFCGGYWKSDDIGTLGADGFLRLHDRRKDVINRGRYKVFSVEGVKCLKGHPCLLEATVVGVPYPVLGKEFTPLSESVQGQKGKPGMPRRLPICVTAIRPIAKSPKP